MEAFGDGLKMSGVVEFASGDDFNRALRGATYEISADGRSLTPIDRTGERSKLKRMFEGSLLYEYLLEHSHLVQLVRNTLFFGNFGALTGIGIINQPAPADDKNARDALEQRLARLLFRPMSAWCAARDVQFAVLSLR